MKKIKVNISESLSAKPTVSQNKELVENFRKAILREIEIRQKLLRKVPTKSAKKV